MYRWICSTSVKGFKQTNRVRYRNRMHRTTDLMAGCKGKVKQDVTSVTHTTSRQQRYRQRERMFYNRISRNIVRSRSYIIHELITHSLPVYLHKILFGLSNY